LEALQPSLKSRSISATSGRNRLDANGLAAITPYFASLFDGGGARFASHLIVDLGLDVAQVSRILGHASTTITLDVYTHLFDDARHSQEIRQCMAASKFASLLDLDFGRTSDAIIPLRAR